MSLKAEHAELVKSTKKFNLPFGWAHLSMYKNTAENSSATFSRLISAVTYLRQAHPGDRGSGRVGSRKG